MEQRQDGTTVPDDPGGERGPVGERDRGGDRALAHAHLRFGWWMLVLFLSLGALLEGLHGFKIGWYLDVSNETRRLMFRLAHAHGTLLGLVNIAFASTVREWDAGAPGSWRTASRALRAASVLLPAGFFLGGLVVFAGDPSPGALLIPIGAVTLLVASVLTASRLGKPRGDSRRS